MSWRLRLSVETILRLTPAVLGSTVFSIAGLCAAHACLDDQALLAAREAIGSSLQTPPSGGARPCERLATRSPAAVRAGVQRVRSHEDTHPRVSRGCIGSRLRRRLTPPNS